MKKSGIKFRVILVAVLAVILVAVSVGTPTFSWFDRANTLSGNGLEYTVANANFTDSNNKQGLYAYDGLDVSDSTKKVAITANQYSSNGDTYTDETAIAPWQALNAYRTLAPGSRDYYKTLIKNNTSSDQNISLYIANLMTNSTSGELSVGVNSPVKAYKNYSIMASSNNVNSATKETYTESPEKVRVYLNPKNAWTYAYSIAPDAYTVEANYGSSGAGSWSDMVFNGRNGDGDPIYYVDVYKDSTFIQFHVKGNSDNWSWTDRKTISLTSKQSVVFWAEADHGTDNGSGNLKLGGPTNVDGPYFNNRWSSTTKVYMRSTLNLSYTKDTDYKGKSASYRATDSSGNSDTSKFTVNASTGVITPKATGTAYLEVTIRGSQYDDPQVIRTQVTVSNIATGQVNVEDAPIIKNVLIPAGQEVSVHWFIMNDKNASANVTYKHSGVYIGL